MDKFVTWCDGMMYPLVTSLSDHLINHSFALRLSGEAARKSMDCLYMNYAQGAKNAVTADISEMGVDFVITFFGQVVLDAGPKHSHLLVSCTRKI